MHKYAFLLGAHPTLSLAEILNYLQNQEIKFGEYLWLRELLIINVGKPPEDIVNLQNELGGVIKIFWIKEEFSGKIFQLDKVLTPAKLLAEFFAQNKTKINFGISIYSDPEPSYAEINWLTNYAHNIKQKLKKDYSIRYVEDKSWNLSSVQVNRNRLIDTGAEIALIRNKEHYYIGKTLTVQDYQSYSTRDWDKPAPDAKSGMLPPKLAQMMINLARGPQTENVFDPFCGSGIVLQEALMLNLKIYGSDISADAIKNTLANLDWLIKLKKLATLKLPSRIKEADATKLKWSSVNSSKTIIAAEPYLGPPLRSMPFPHQVKAITDELNTLYSKFFKNLQNNFSEIEKICIVFPVLKTKEGLKYLEILDFVHSLGYEKVSLLPEEIMKKDSSVSFRGGILYSRPDQLVLREIFVFKKTK